MSEQLIKALRRQELISLMTIVDVECVRPLKEEIDVLGHNIGPLVVGKNYKLSLWIAETLAERRYVQFTSSDDILWGEFTQIAFGESTNISDSNPSDLGDNMLSLGRLKINIKKNLAAKGLVQNLDYKKNYNDMRDLIMVRIRKYLSKSMNYTNPYNMDELSIEERILFKEISDLVGDWLKFYLQN